MRFSKHPEAAISGGRTHFIRNLTLGPCSHPLSLLLCEKKGVKPIIKGQRIWIRNKTNCWTAGVTKAPAGTRFVFDEGKVILKFPALKKKTNLRVFLTRVGFPRVDPARWLVNTKAEDLKKYTKGGPKRWAKELTTRGQLGKDDRAYTVDDIPGPIDNPWKSWMRFGAHDFFKDGRAAISTWDGDVWVVSGLDAELKKVRWKRFATGLMHPLGLKIINEKIYVAGRDQITRLHDLNNDGEADFHECFNNHAGLTPQRHEYVLDLQVDKKGNLYYGRSGHYTTSQRRENCCVMRVSPDGKKMDVFAHGFREPNGLSIGPDGIMTVGDNEGNGVPQTPIYVLKEDQFYGFTPPGTKKKSGWKPGAPVLVWIPKTVDRSAGGQIWVTSKKWGPLHGQLLHTSYGDCRLFHVMVDRVGETLQGFASPFPHIFKSGIMRSRFHPKDGQLYLCGLRGWGTKAAKDGQFCRVRYTGKAFDRPLTMSATAKGFRLTFDQKLDRTSVEDSENWGGEIMDVYKSKGKTKKKEDLDITKVTLAKDGKTVHVEIDDMKPMTSVTLLYSIKSLKNEDLSGSVYGTVNRVRSARPGQRD